MFVTNWISTTKIQKISEITNFFRHYFLSRTEVFFRQFKLTLENNHKLSENEYRICMLVWLGFTPCQMKILMNMSSSNISNIRKRLSKKLFDKEMTTSKFDDEIRKIRAVN